MKIVYYDLHFLLLQLIKLFDNIMLFLEFLKSIGLSGSSESILKEIIQTRTLKRSEYFIKEKSICKEFAFVEKGMLKHFYNTSKNEITRWVSIKGNIITSFASLINKQPGAENIIAITPAKLSVIKIEDWEELNQFLPELNIIWKTLVEQYCIGLEDRIYHLIAFDSKENYEFLFKNYPEMIKLVPSKYIASILGIEPRHLSRLRRGLMLKNRHLSLS